MNDSPIKECEKCKPKECGYCKYYEQGKNNSFCGNPNQLDSDKKKYCYYCFSCNLFDAGVAKSRIIFSNNPSAN